MSTKQRLDHLARLDEHRGTGFAEDRAFFEQNPDCEYRMRLASRAEVAAAEITGMPVPDGDQFLWMAIRQLAPGKRLRLGVLASASLEPSEATARRIFGDAAEEHELVPELAKALESI